MNAHQMAVVLLAAGVVLVIVGLAFEYRPLTFTALPFLAGAVYCTYRRDWE